MFDKVKQKITEYTRMHRLRQRWQTAVTCLAAIVVFCTTYALILPAITLDGNRAALWNSWFGAGSKYGLASDSDADYDTASPSDAQPWRIPILSASSPDDQDGELMDDLWEIPGHVHTDACFAEREILTCTEEEREGHRHSDDCYGKRKGDLICENTDEDHVHTADCYEWEEVLFCKMEEDEGHHHGEGCFEKAKVLICMEPEPHVHDEACYDENGIITCIYAQWEDHVHTADCYETRYMLICGESEGETSEDTASPSNAQKAVGEAAGRNPANDEDTESEAAKNEEAESDDTEAVEGGASLASASNAESQASLVSAGHGETVYSKSRRSKATPSNATPNNAQTADDGSDGEDDGIHHHGQECYEPVLVLACGIYRPTENTIDGGWEETIPNPLSGNWVEDLLAVAESQVGYTESSADYIKTKSGETQGYTWYGDWYGDPYGNWDSMFVSFCLNYAGIPEEAMPREKNPQSWLELLSVEEWNLYADAEHYIPSPGDLVFFDTDGDGEADRTGIVSDYTEGEGITTIEGDVREAGDTEEIQLMTLALTEEDGEEGTEQDSGEAENGGTDQVDYVSYSLRDNAIVGYALTSSLAADDVETVDAFYLWLYLGTQDDKVANYSIYSFGGEDEDKDLGKTAEGVLRQSGTNYYLIPINYFTGNYGSYGYHFDETATEECPFQYAPDASASAANLTKASYVQVDNRWYVQIEDNGNYGEDAPGRSNIYYPGAIVYEKVPKFRLWMKKKEDNNTPEPVKAYPVGGELENVVLHQTGTNYYLIPINYFTDNYGYQFEATATEKCPFKYAPDANYPDNPLIYASYVQVNGSWYVQIEDTGDYGEDTTPRSNVYMCTYTTVEDAVRHPSSVINLFNYWVTDDDTDPNNNESFMDAGINEGHILKFSNSFFGQVEGAKINCWTGNSTIREGTVGKNLIDGYPALSGSAEISAEKELLDGEDYTSGSEKESLAYLFDPTMNVKGKSSYRDVAGLLQIDDDGYYYYNSAENFAEYSNNRFTLYNGWGVYTGGNSPNGQFFPFNAMDEVAERKSTDPPINHYLGMTLTTRFVQQYDGHTNSDRKKDTIFRFAGDDDVWIFIDGVLVADLGGIHDAASVEINFADGTVKINEDSIVTEGSQKSETTLRAAFENAGKTISEKEWEDNTFANNTYHTLRFYYLERGNTDSNLYLTYNLTEIPPTAIYKVNQYGNAVEGASFAVYKTDENYQYLSTDGIAQTLPENYSYDNDGDILDVDGNIFAEAVYLGTTDSAGEMVFKDDEGMPYTLAELQEKFGDHFVLREVKVPEGYRLVSNEVRLFLQGNVLLCDNVYESGAWAEPTLLVTAPGTLLKAGTEEGTVLYYDLEETVDGNGIVPNGTLFAVVLKYNGGPGGKLDEEANWAPVYGNSEAGYKVIEGEGSFIERAIAAAQENQKEDGDYGVFRIGASGSMQVELSNLPGDLTNYYYMLPEDEKNQTEYTVAYYWTEGSLDEASDSNTWRIDADPADDAHASQRFERAFGANINVPNLTNRLFAQKFNEKGDLVNGAVFALYKVEETAEDLVYYVSSTGEKIFLDADGDGDNRGTARPVEGNSPYVYVVDPATGVITVGNWDDQTGDFSYEYCKIKPSQIGETLPADQNESKEDGTAVFSAVEDGKYYLREIAAPDGYILNTAEVRVLIDNDAVYAHAGTAGDGVIVGRGPGYLVATMTSFASEGDVDNTLTWIYQMMRVSDDKTKSFSAYENGAGQNWAYLKDQEGQNLKTHLVYEPDSENTLFNYTVNSDFYGAAAEGVTRRLYTDEGWSYYEIYQDKDYHDKLDSAANYTDLGDKEIANLFSRSVYVQITDKRNILTIEKIDAGTKRTLSGARFVLYRKDENGPYYYLKKDSETGQMSWIEETGQLPGDALTGYELTTDENGQIVFWTSFGSSLDGTYHLKETSAPTGYYLINGEIAFKVQAEKLVEDQSSTTGVKVSEDGLKLVVPNSAYSLPSTGGHGSRWYLLAGLILLTGAAAYAIYMRRSFTEG